MAPRIRRGEELPVTRTLATLGVLVLRTIHSNDIIKDGNFAWLNSSTAVIGRAIRVNDEAISQLDDVLKRQGAELLVVDLGGYLIHIDGAFVMINPGLAILDPSQLPLVSSETQITGHRQHRDLACRQQLDHQLPGNQSRPGDHARRCFT